MTFYEKHDFSCFLLLEKTQKSGFFVRKCFQHTSITNIGEIHSGFRKTHFQNFLTFLRGKFSKVSGWYFEQKNDFFKKFLLPTTRLLVNISLLNAGMSMKALNFCWQNFSHFFRTFFLKKLKNRYFAKNVLKKCFSLKSAMLVSSAKRKRKMVFCWNFEERILINRRSFPASFKKKLFFCVTLQTAST